MSAISLSFGSRRGQMSSAGLPASRFQPEHTISMRLASGLILAGVHQPMSTDNASALSGYRPLTLLACVDFVTQRLLPNRLCNAGSRRGLLPCLSPVVAPRVANSQRCKPPRRQRVGLPVPLEVFCWPLRRGVDSHRVMSTASTQHPCKRRGSPAHIGWRSARCS
jgi:hypothetical protein